MAFEPQSIAWPSSHAVLMVHGIGNASESGDAAFPLAALRAALGAEADNVAVYHLNYDFINDWAAAKVEFAGALAALRASVSAKLTGHADNSTLADYIGDVLWPVLSANIRFAVRDAYIAQLTQIQIDRGEAALARGDDPLDYTVSIIAHSLGCFHTYEVLWATCTTPELELQPRSDLFVLDAVTLMASPVQLIRSVADAIEGFIPDVASLACVARPLAIPAEERNGRTTRCARRFISVTGNVDLVGGHLAGSKLPWAYMALDGQESVIDSQSVLTTSTPAALFAGLTGGSPGALINDPHSWESYIARHAALLRGVA